MAQPSRYQYTQVVGPLVTGVAERMAWLPYLSYYGKPLPYSLYYPSVIDPTTPSPPVFDPATFPWVPETFLPARAPYARESTWVTDPTIPSSPVVAGGTYIPTYRPRRR